MLNSNEAYVSYAYAYAFAECSTDLLRLSMPMVGHKKETYNCR
jgi:hypothetical protein